MSHTIEPATSGRAKCRGCKKAIAKGELRLGERLPNPFGDGEMTLWFHLLCGAYKRPEVLLEAVDATDEALPDREALESAARFGLDHRRLPRLDGAQLATTGRARCRACRELIAKDAWRLPLVFYQEGRFEPSGYIHANCAQAHLGTDEILDRARHFSPELTDAQVVDLDEQLRKSKGKT